jgi:proline dehydrogenase
MAQSGSIAELKESLRQFLGVRHVVGLTTREAVVAALAEAKRGNAATLGYLAHQNETPSAISAHLLDAVEAIAEAGLKSSISIKVDLLDAQAHDTADPTFALFEEGLALGADLSATLPSRWERSPKDAERLIELGVPIRVVKGQGKDPEHPKIDPRSSFLELVKQLAGRAAEVAVATHDRRVAEPALDLLMAAGTPCWLEQLGALPRLDSLAVERGVPVRVYVAYGQSGLPYAINQVVRRPAIVGWILRDLLVRRRPQPTGSL